MIQGGDPAGDGTGGESAWGGTFADEIKADSPLYRDGYRRGIVAMANAGPNTNGSQFFILHDDYPLPPSYVIFARVTAGMDVVDAIANTPTTMGADGGMSRPLTPPSDQEGHDSAVTKKSYCPTASRWTATGVVRDAPDHRRARRFGFQKNDWFPPVLLTSCKAHRPSNHPSASESTRTPRGNGALGVATWRTRDPAADLSTSRAGR